MGQRGKHNERMFGRIVSHCIKESRFASIVNPLPSFPFLQTLIPLKNQSHKNINLSPHQSFPSLPVSPHHLPNIPIIPPVSTIPAPTLTIETIAIKPVAINPRVSIARSISVNPQTAEVRAVVVAVGVDARVDTAWDEPLVALFGLLALFGLWGLGGLLGLGGC